MPRTSPADQPELPDQLRRLWRRVEPSRLGRPAALDLDRVVAAAVELADRDGLAGVTLPKVGAALGVTSMALYRYVGSKDDLLVLMGDAALGPPPSLPVAPGSWKEGLRRWAVGLWEVYRRRPWLVRVPVSGPPAGPNQIGWMDRALVALRGTALSPAAKVGVLTLLSGYVRHTALLDQELTAGRPAGRGQAGVTRDYGRHLATLVDPDRFPEAARLFATPVFEAAPARGSAAGDFGFGLELILNGITGLDETAVASSL